MNRNWLRSGFLILVLAGFAGEALAAGHYELVWFRQWDRSECGLNHIFQVWVFDEFGNRMPDVEIRDENGSYLLNQYGSPMIVKTSPQGERAEIAIWDYDFGVSVYDPAGATSDASPVVTTRYGGDFGHYCYDAAFVYKPDVNDPGDADVGLKGTLPTRTNSSDDNPYTKSMVYCHQNWDEYFNTAAWDLRPNSDVFHSQTFVTTNVNRLLGCYLFAVQPGVNSCRFGIKIHYGGPDGPVVYEKEQPIDYYFAQPLAFGVDDCPVIPNAQYTITMDPIEPDDSNVYYYPGTNYPDGQYFQANGIGHPDKDMFGFVYGWDAGQGTHGMILGTISDTNGDPIVNANVTLSDGPTGGTVQTSDSGVYIFTQVLPGTYTVSVDRPGYDSDSSSGHGVVADQATEVDFTLTPLVQELTNVGFEMDLYAWNEYGAAPQPILAGAAGYQPASGSRCAGVILPDAPATGGLYQRVPVLPGEDYQATFNLFTTSTLAKARIGIDPTGGTDPAASVVWSALSTSAGTWSVDSDTTKRVSLTASGTLATVFIEYTTVSNGTVLVDNVRLYRTTGAAPASDASFSAGWSLASVPLLDADGEPVSSVFDDVIIAGNSLEGNVASYNGSGYDFFSVDFVDVLRGDGYWLNLSHPASEDMSAPLPPDPVVKAIDSGWNLIGQPHRHGTPLSGLVFSDGAEPAWHDVSYDSKMKYRSDNGVWSWVSGAETVFEWTVYVDSAGSPEDYPRIKVRDAAELLIAYSAAEGAWHVGSSAPRTSGGVQIGGNWAVVAPPDAWQTIRVYYNDATLEWALTIDGKMDNAHHMEGTVSGGAGGPYVQFGVISSDHAAEYYTKRIVWGQNSEIDNWPANKIYDASSGQDPLVNPGWGSEGSGDLREFSSVGVIVKSFADAADAGWVEPYAIGYDPDQGYEIVRTAGGDLASLIAWRGYWLSVNQPGLSVWLPGPAEAAGGVTDTVSSVKLTLSADDAMDSSFIASLAPSATSGYEGDHDAMAPPAGPAGQLEAVFGTTVNSQLMLADGRSVPASGTEQVWSGTMHEVGFSGCKDVTVSWNLADVGSFGYKLIDVNSSTETVMTSSNSYTFQLCDGDALPFEIRTKDGGYPQETIEATAWRSMVEHGSCGWYPIDLDPVAAAGDAVVESRYPGVGMVEVDISAPAASVSVAGVVEAVDQSTLVGHPATSVTVVDNGDGSSTLAIEFAGALPDEGCYLIDLSTAVAGITGDTDCLVIGLMGDTSGDRGIKINDLLQIRSKVGTGILSAGARFDVNGDCQINIADLLLTRSLVGGMVSCP